MSIVIGVLIGLTIGLLISALLSIRVQNHACRCIEHIRDENQDEYGATNMGDYGFEGAGEFGGSDFPDLPAENKPVESQLDEGTPREFELYKDTAGEFRWRLRARNGRIIASSSDGYINKSDAEHAIRLVKNATSATTVQDLT